VAYKITFTDGVIRQFPLGTQPCCIALDESKNKWAMKKVQDLQAGDHLAFYYEAKGPTQEVQVVEAV